MDLRTFYCGRYFALLGVLRFASGYSEQHPRGFPAESPYLFRGDG